MRKEDELTKNHTCMQHAHSHMQHAHSQEMVFGLFSRDPPAPVAVRAWVAERIRLGKNVATDEQVVEALSIAQTMEEGGRMWADRQLATCDGFTRGLIVRAYELPRGHSGDHGLRGGDGTYL